MSSRPVNHTPTRSYQNVEGNPRTPSIRQGEQTHARQLKNNIARSPGTPKVVGGSKGANDIFSLTDAALAERYKFIEEIGYGNWGSVWKCQSRALLESQPESKLAVKLVHRSKNPTSSARVRSLWTEFKAIRSLRPQSHPNVVHFECFIITASYALISMDHHPKLMPVQLAEPKAKDYFRQLVDAVGFLHRNGLTHNDIKPANILLSVTDAPILVDFGFAQQYPPTANDRFLSSLSWGTPEYLSPERAKGALHDERLSDIWALGVTMYEIVVGRTPFEMNDTEEFLTREALEVYYHRTTSGTFFGTYEISSQLDDLIHGMVHPDLDKRLKSCSDALRHKFFDPPSPVRKAPGYGPISPKRQINADINGTPKREIRTPARSPVVKQTPRKAIEPKKPFKVFDDARDVTGRHNTPGTPTRTAVGQRKEPSSPTTKTKPYIHKSPLAESTSGIINTNAEPSNAATTPSRIPIRKPEISSPIHGQSQNQKPQTNLRSSQIARGINSRIPTSAPSSASESEGRGGNTGFGFMSTKRVIGPSVEVSKPPSSQLSKSIADQSVEVLKERRVEKPATYSDTRVDSSMSESETGAISPCSDNERQLSTHANSRSSSRSRSNTFTGRFRKLSIRNKSNSILTNSQAGKSTSILALGSKLKKESRNSVVFTMINQPGHEGTDQEISISSNADKSADDIASERAELEDFSRQIQEIIDTKKAKSLARRAMSPPPTVPSSDAEQKTILSGTQILELRKQFEKEVELSRPAIAKEKTGPVPVTRSTSNTRNVPSRSDASIHKADAARNVPRVKTSFTPSLMNDAATARSACGEEETVILQVRNRRHPQEQHSQTARLAPGQTHVEPVPESPNYFSTSTSEDTSQTSNMEDRTVVFNSMTSSMAPPLATSTPMKMTPKEKEYRKGHKRIPTPIRNVPSILLTESADEASESEFSRCETPMSDGGRVMSPPPVRVMEEGRQLPVWVPTSDEDDFEGERTQIVRPRPTRGRKEEDATVTMRQPNRLKKVQSPRRHEEKRRPMSPLSSSSSLSLNLFSSLSLRGTPFTRIRSGHQEPQAKPEGEEELSFTTPFTTNIIPLPADSSDEEEDKVTHMQINPDEPLGGASGISRKASIRSFFSRSVSRASSRAESFSTSYSPNFACSNTNLVDSRPGTPGGMSMISTSQASLTMTLMESETEGVKLVTKKEGRFRRALKKIF